MSAYERWTWERCCAKILSLKNRLGYGESLWILGFDVLDDGRVIDPFQGIEYFNPVQHSTPMSTYYQSSAIPEMYCLLSTYALAPENPLTGTLLSPNSLNPILRFELTAEESSTLFQYFDKTVSTDQSTFTPFFGRNLHHGDYSFTVWPLPRVPVTFILWQGDEQIDDGGTVLFDSSIRQYLPGLIVELARLTVWRLRNILDPTIKWE